MVVKFLWGFFMMGFIWVLLGGGWGWIAVIFTIPGLGVVGRSSLLGICPDEPGATGSFCQGMSPTPPSLYFRRYDEGGREC